MEPTQELLELLKSKEFSKVNDYFTNDDYKPLLAERISEILPPLVDAIVNENTNEEDFEKCTRWIKTLTSCVPPKEMLLFLLEQFELHSSVHLLAHLKDVLLLMPAKRGSSLEWVLNTVSSFIKNLLLPNEYNLEGEERKLLDFEPEVKAITDTLPFFLDFLEPFVIEVSLTREKRGKPFLEERIHHQRNVLREFITKIFGHPLVYLDLHNEPGDAKSTARVHAEKLLRFLSQLEGNTMKLCDSNVCCDDLEKRLPVEDSVLALSTATVSYLLLAENTGSTINSVYSAQFLLREHLKHVIVLVKETPNVVIHKGLLLLKSLLEKLSPSTLCVDTLEIPETITVIRCLFNVMIHCQVKELRKMGLTVFDSYIWNFNPEAKSQLLCSLIQILPHSGAKSVIIQRFKDGVYREMVEPQSKNYFLGATLANFILLAAVLPHDAETDIVDRTGAWRVLGSIRKKFLVPLRTGLELSRAHYKLEIRNVNEKTDSQSTVSVGGQTLPNLTQKQQTEMYSSAVIFFDMIESVLARLEEIICQQEKECLY